MKDSKVVIITGASSGIGAGTAQHFAQIGYKKLALVARRKEELERVAEQCKRNGAENVLILVKDLMVPEQCQEVIDETVKEFGQIDILISNAGLARQISVRDTKVEDFESIIKLNLTAPFALTKYALPHLEKTKGNIVYNSSVMGQVPGPNLSAYCASKAALDHFVRCVAVEEAPKGIRVNCLSPGLTIQETMVTSAGNKLDEEGFAKTSAMFAGMQPLGRPAKIEEIARMFAFMASEENSFMTGSIVASDGGFRYGQGFNAIPKDSSNALTQ